MILTSSKKECSYHVTHQWLVAESDNIDICFAKVGPVSKQSCEQAIASLSGEAKYESPMQKPLRLVEHLHRQLAVPTSQNVLQLSNRGQLCALTTLFVLNLACEESPKDLSHELRVLICRVYQNFLQIEQVLLGL